MSICRTLRSRKAPLIQFLSPGRPAPLCLQPATRRGCSSQPNASAATSDSSPVSEKMGTPGKSAALDKKIAEYYEQQLSFPRLLSELRGRERITSALRTQSADWKECLKDSTLMHLHLDGSLQGQGRLTERSNVKGVVTSVVGPDAYIDVGSKFSCVCPIKPGVKCEVGSEVTVVLTNLELTAKFLGQERDMTLLEADGSLLTATPEPRPKRDRKGGAARPQGATQRQPGRDGLGRGTDRAGRAEG